MHSGGKEFKDWDSERNGPYESFYKGYGAIEKNDLVVITIKSIVRKHEAQKISNDILQHLGGNGITLVDLGGTARPLKQKEYEEYLDEMDLMED